MVEPPHVFSAWLLKRAVSSRRFRVAAEGLGLAQSRSEISKRCDTMQALKREMKGASVGTCVTCDVFLLLFQITECFCLGGLFNNKDLLLLVVFGCFCVFENPCLIGIFLDVLKLTCFRWGLRISSTPTPARVSVAEWGPARTMGGALGGNGAGRVPGAGVQND